MARIEFEGVCTVFGAHPVASLRQVRAGMDKAALLQRTGHTLALLDVNLRIEAGEIFVIMGLSGSGKSTLLRHVNRLLEPTVGRVSVDGIDLGTLDAASLVRLRRDKVAMVFQRFALLPQRSVIDNVGFALELRGVARPLREAQARQWIAQVGLGGVEGQLPAQLSGGMQQRVGLARALCAGTPMILMDEPFSALDPLIRSQLQGELLALHAAAPRTIVFVTHDLDEALRLGSRVAILQDGRVLQVGTPAQLLLQPADAHVADFVRDVNRARAWRVADALAPWPADRPLPALRDAVHHAAALEDVLPLLLGRRDALAVRRDGHIVGQVDVDRLRALLAPNPAPTGEAEALPQQQRPP